MTIADEKQAEIDELRAETHHLQAKNDDLLEIARKAERMLLEAEHYNDTWSTPQFLSDEPSVTHLSDAIKEYQQAYGGLN